MPNQRLYQWLQRLQEWAGGSDGGQPGPPRRRYVAAAVGILVLATLLSLLMRPEASVLSYSEFKSSVDRGRVARVTFEGQQIHGRFVAEVPDSDKAAGDATAKGGSDGQAEGSVPFQAGGRFETTMPQVADAKLLPLLERHGVEITAETAGGGIWGRLLVSFVPWVLLLGGFLYLSWRMQRSLTGGSGRQEGIFGFAKSEAKRFREQDTQIGLDDVAGLANAKADLVEIIDHLADPKRFRWVGATMLKGVLLVGPPGTGKTMLARAVAGEAGVPYYSIGGSEFVEMFVGVGASRVRDLFEAAKNEAPCVIFIDEIDAVGRSRGAGLGGGRARADAEPDPERDGRFHAASGRRRSRRHEPAGRARQGPAAAGSFRPQGLSGAARPACPPCHPRAARAQDRAGRRRGAGSARGAHGRLLRGRSEKPDQ